MATLLEYAAFGLLVGLPVAYYADQLPDRLRDLRTGIRGVLYVPLLWAILVPAAILAVQLAEAVPLLEWGWLGANAAVAPLEDAGSVGGGGGAGGSSVLAAAVPAVLVVVVCVAFVLFNYYEEHALYRESYRGVFLWAALHLVMGVPIFTIVPLFAVGVGFKAIYDRHGREVAYAAHVASNLGLLGLFLAARYIGAA